MILIAFGANLPSAYGSVLETLVEAIARLDALDDVDVVSVSNIYKTAPVPVSDQPWYHNGVLAVETTLSARDLLVALHEIELAFGRERVAGAAGRNAARVLDLDIVAYHDLVIEEDGLQIPHPRMDERAFVLWPLYDVAPEWKHPVTGRCVTEMIELLPDGQEIEKIEAKLYDTAA